MKILLLVNYWPEQVSYISDLAITVCSRPSESESAELNNYWYRNTHIPAVGGTCVFPDLNPNSFNMLLTISYNMYSSDSTTKKKRCIVSDCFFSQVPNHTWSRSPLFPNNLFSSLLDKLLNLWVLFKKRFVLVQMKLSICSEKQPFSSISLSLCRIFVDDFHRFYINKVFNR